MLKRLAFGFVGVFILVLLVTGLASDIFKKVSPESYNPYPKVYNRNGPIIQRMKLYCDTLVPTTSSGQSINISAAGFTSVCNVVVTPMRNTSTIDELPIIALKTISTTAVTVNMIEPNTSIVSILGSGVLLGGAANFYSSPTSVTLHVTAMGY